MAKPLLLKAMFSMMTLDFLHGALGWSAIQQGKGDAYA